MTLFEGSGLRKNELGAIALLTPVICCVAALLHQGALGGHASIEITRLLLFLVVAPIIEEAAFRGFIQPALQDLIVARRWTKHPVLVSVLLSSLLFALCHLWSKSPLWAGLTFIPSLALGTLRAQGGSLLACATLHSVFNLTYLVVNTFRQ